jgi:peptide/nickel transport system permease protein
VDRDQQQDPDSPIRDPRTMTLTPSPASLEPEETSGPTAMAITVPGALAPGPGPGEPLLTTEAEERVAVATQAQLMWRRFRKHRLAMVGAIAVILFYLVVLFADFLAYVDPEAADAQRGLIAPQGIQWFHDGQFKPHVFALVGKRDPQTFKRVYAVDPSQIVPLTFFAPGFDYKLFGFIPANRHLIGVQDANPEETLFLLGTDLEGRDMWSRIMFATRTSLTIGLVAVVVSLVLGVILGGISGFYGGMADTVIQRVIEILRSVPTIPLWMGLAAAMPKSWSIMQVYFTITIIISLIGWTELARVVRGRFLSLREEDFVTAADLVGASQSRIIFVHMVPLFLSHIIAATTLALPAMIISETALSFLGLGLRPPAISWGVLLQQAQNVQTVALSPWLLIPAIPVILVILAFNFLGDGLRDAADPYA